MVVGVGHGVVVGVGPHSRRVVCRLGEEGGVGGLGPGAETRTPRGRLGGRKESRGTPLILTKVGVGVFKSCKVLHSRYLLESLPNRK